MSSNLEQAAEPDFLPALEKYTRTATVTAQLTTLSRLPRAAVLRRAAATGPAERLERETLVALARAYLRAGDEAAVSAVLTHLADRVRIALRARAAAWGIGPHDLDDAGCEATLKLMAYVRTLGASEEFWECNFTTSFNLRMDTVFKTLKTRRMPTVEPPEDFHEEMGLDEAGFGEIEVRETIAALSGGDPRLGEFLYLRMENYSDIEISGRLKVTPRTLRNWACRAQALWIQGGH